MNLTNKHITNNNLLITISKGDLYEIQSFKSSVARRSEINGSIGCSQSRDDRNYYSQNSKRSNIMEHPEMLTGGRNAKQDVNNNKSNNQFIKRSNVMKYNRFIKIAATIFVALTIVVSGAFSQGNAVLNGTVNNNGIIKIKGTLSGATTTITGIVEFNAVAAQSIPAGYTFTNLTASGGGADKTITAGTTTVLGVLTVNNPTKSLLLGAGTLNLTGATPITLTAGTINFASGTVNYNGNIDQAVYGTTYANLTTSGALAAHTKTAGGPVTVTGTITNGANTTLDFVANNFVGTGATFANSATLKSSGTVTVTAAAAIGGTFEYAAAGAQTVAPASYTNLTFSNAGIKTFTSGQTYSIAGIYTPGAAANVYTGSTINYNSAVAGQTIADVSYGNLTFSNQTKAWTLSAPRTITGDLTVNSAATVTGAFNLNVTGNVALNSNLTANTVAFANASSVVSGTGDIIGSVTRAHAFVAATAYTYNNTATTVALSAPVASETFTMTSTPNTYPTSNNPGNTVKRKYIPSYTLFSSGTADVKLGYLQAEGSTLGVTESKLKDFESVVSSGSKIGGSYTRVTSTPATFGSVLLPAITPAIMVSGQELVLDDRFNQFIATLVGGDWNTPGTWDMAAVPAATDDAIINATGVTLNAAGHVNNLVINATKDLTLGLAGSALTVDGSMTNNGGLTLSNAGSTLTVTGTLTNVAGSTITNAGTITVQ
jgi:hypothetical protein